MNQLQQLKQFTTVVADTGDFDRIAQYGCQDATTNPSLILKAARQPVHGGLLRKAAAAHRPGPVDASVDALLVRFGIELLKVVPGRVSTEVDARLSFDVAASVARARRIMTLYEDAGIPRDRVLIKLAATWEGIQAARMLEHEGIHCNLTLVFAFCQAVTCGDANVTLISPFVGRIYDWYKHRAGADWNEAAYRGPHDPGVKSVAAIYTYFKRFGVQTLVMGASFRNVGQIHALAGCDLLTISPELLEELQSIEQPLPRALDPDRAMQSDIHAVTFNESSFRYALNDDSMAHEKLAEGIRNFAVDALALEQLVAEGCA